MKKLAYALVIALVLVTGCGKEEKNKEKQENDKDIVFRGQLEDYASQLYEGIAEENLPMMLGTLSLTEEDIEYYIGTKDIKWKSAIASESMVGAIPHSIVIIRMSEEATEEDYEDAMTKIKENANPRKWVCVEAKNVYVERRGNLIALIMTDDLADTIKANFKKFKRNTLEDYASQLYEGIAEENLPMMLGNTPLTEENIEYYIGTKDIKWESAIASESMVGSVPHSVVIIRMSEEATEEDYKDAMTKIKENANPRKWICVEAENVYVERNGNLITLIMSNELADTIKANFKNIK